MSKYILLFLFISISSFSQVIGFKEGVGITNSLNGNIGIFSVSYEDKYNNIAMQKTELGLWTDSIKNHSGSGYGAYSLGIKVKPDSFYLEAYLGGAFITNTDKLLSTHFEFMHDLGFGLQSKRKSIGLNFKHLSNAGIKKPNIGRNFLQISVKFPLF